MDGIASTLAGEVGQEQVHVGLPDGSVLIKALKKISGTENVQNILLHGYIGSCPLSEWVGQGSEGFAVGQGLVVTALLEKNRCGGQQYRSDRESPVGFHGRASSFLRSICRRPIWKRRCRRKSIASDTTNTSQPENM